MGTGQGILHEHLAFIASTHPGNAKLRCAVSKVMVGEYHARGLASGLALIEIDHLVGMGQGILHAHLALIAPTYPGYASLVG